MFGFTGEPSCWGLVHRSARWSELDIITRSIVWRSIGKQYIIVKNIDKLLQNNVCRKEFFFFLEKEKRFFLHALDSILYVIRKITFKVSGVCLDGICNVSDNH